MESRKELDEGPVDLAKRRALAKYARTITGMSVVALTAVEAVGAANAYTVTTVPGAGGGFGPGGGFGAPGGPWGAPGGPKGTP
ncbi:hypothetical protein [Antarctobacter jejuensis]|uniref:hypothetical protein n=1 Tax=Antarctobacter jejuensis TaxID=1439938 RepID=UPI003FD38F85